MSEDARCCGSGTCIIDNQGLCWCGQQWDGEKMCLPALGSLSAQTAPVPNAAGHERPQDG